MHVTCLFTFECFNAFINALFELVTMMPGHLFLHYCIYGEEKNTNYYFSSVEYWNYFELHKGRDRKSLLEKEIFSRAVLRG